MTAEDFLSSCTEIMAFLVHPPSFFSSSFPNYLLINTPSGVPLEKFPMTHMLPSSFHTLLLVTPHKWRPRWRGID